MALITRCNIWTQLNTLSPFTDAAPCVSHRYDAGKNSAASTTTDNPRNDVDSLLDSASDVDRPHLLASLRQARRSDELCCSSLAL